MSLRAIVVHGLLSPLGAAGAVALAGSACSTGFLLRGLARSVLRLVRQLAVHSSGEGLATFR